jgi:hypothetical protein
VQKIEIEGVIMIDGVDEAIATMTPAEATAALAAMSAASNPPPPLVPQDSQDARAQLDVLTGNADWSRSLMAGDIAVRAQFDKLVAAAADADPVGDALANIQEPEPIFETTMFGELPSRVVREVIADMRAFNISNGAIEEGIAGTPVAAHEHAATVALQSMKFGDAEWTNRLLRGEWSATREWKLMCNILSRPIAEPK